MYLSANYFGDLIKKETGISARVYPIKNNGRCKGKDF